MTEKETLQKKIYNLNKERKVQLVIFGIVIICIGLLLMKYVKSEDCYVKEYTLLDQTLEFNAECNVLQCLFIDVVDEDDVKATLHFDSDTKLLSESFDINIGDQMKIKWCNIEGIGYRVRGVSKS